MSFICMRMKNHFHIKGWALNLVLIQRPRRKWRIVTVKRAFLHEKSMKTGGKAIDYEQPLLARLFYLNPLTRNAKTDFVTQNPCSSRISINRSRNGLRALRVVPISLRDKRASETRARVRITPREKGETRRWERKMRDYRQTPSSLSPPRLPFLFPFVPEEKWGLLVVYGIRYCFWLCLGNPKNQVFFVECSF